MTDASTWPKQKQYYYYLNSLWGKMIATVNCGTGEIRDLRGICPNQARLTGVICPRFDEADIARIIPIYLSLYPEHRGYEERLIWIIRCTFGPGCVPMPAGAARRAPYVQQRRRPVYVEPVTRYAVSPAIPRPESPAVTPVQQQPTTTPGTSRTWLIAGAIIAAAILISRK